MAIVVRQHVAASAQPATIAFPSLTLSGSLVVVFFHRINTDATTPPTDSGSNTYVDSGAGGQNNNGGTSWCRIFYSANANVTQTITSPDTTHILSMHAYEITGASSVDVFTSGQGTTVSGGTNNCTAGPMTTTAADIVICGMVNDVGPDSVGTNVAWTSPDGDVQGFLQYFVQSAAGSITGNVSDGGASDKYGIVMVSFKPPVVNNYFLLNIW